MEIRFQRIFLMMLLIGVIPMFSSATSAPNVTKAESFNGINTALSSEIEDVPVEIERREILEDILDSENFEVGIQLGQISIEDFESNLWFSGHIAYHINEYFYAKALYGTSKAGETSFEKLVNVPPLLTDDQRKLNYYGLNVGYNLLPGEVFLSEKIALNSLFSIEVGGGNTEFAGNDQFTINLTANYRLYLTDWLTWDIGMSDYIFDTKITGESKTTHNLNFTTGVAFYF